MNVHGGTVEVHPHLLVDRNRSETSRVFPLEPAVLWGLSERGERRRGRDGEVSVYLSTPSIWPHPPPGACINYPSLSDSLTIVVRGRLRIIDGEFSLSRERTLAIHLQGAGSI